MTDFTDAQITALRAPLARENVKDREQAGRKVYYIEGWVVIAEANRIFGFDGWDRETVECRVVCERERKIGQQQRDGWQVSYVARVRVTVRPSTDVEGAVRREGTGYGSGIDVDLGAAHESAIKEAETDAMKRALMTFGNPFGLALYDKAQAEVEPVASRLQPQPHDNGNRGGTIKQNGNGTVLPPHPEEPPEMRLKRAAVRIAGGIETAPSDHVCDLVMDDARDDLAAIEAVREPIFKFKDGLVAGVEAAKRLRARHNSRIAELRSGK